MAGYFLDTSALVKLYVQDPGTDRLLSLVNARPGDRVAVLNIAVVETRSAIRRRQRAGDIDPEAAAAIIESLQGHIETRFLLQDVDQMVIEAALEMIDRYALRAYDALQLAGCIVISDTVLEAFTFVCSDHRLLEAAASEQLNVLDPAA